MKEIITKKMTIDVSEIKEFVKLVQMERDLAVHMQELLYIQQRALEYTKKVAEKAKRLNDFKRKYQAWFRTLDPEMKKVLHKHGRWM